VATVSDLTSTATASFGSAVATSRFEFVVVCANVERLLKTITADNINFFMIINYLVYNYLLFNHIEIIIPKLECQATNLLNLYKSVSNQ
jgi:hypothetical protein